MVWLDFHHILLLIQHTISFIGVFIILSDVIYALCQYVYFIFTDKFAHQGEIINNMRLTLGRVLILGLEFIVAADLIGTTTTPDYYAVGLFAIIVIIRTILSYSISRELMTMNKENR